MLNIAAFPGTTLMPSDAKQHAARAPRGPVHYAVKRQEVQSAWVSRTVDATHATMMLIASGQAAALSGEWLEMQRAVIKQLHALGESWLEGWTAWSQECTALKAANTMSKIAEQEFNLIGQFRQLLTNQATDLVELMENAQVGYGFWVKEKLQESRAGGAGGV